MFICPVSPENECNDDLKSLYSSKFNLSPDIKDCKRTIVIHDKVNFEKSSFQGIITINCQIINLSILDGKYVQAEYSPETFLVKTVYNGFITTSTDNFPKDLKISEEFLRKSNFRISNAYTTMIGMWSVYEENDNFSSIGVSVLNMVDLSHAVRLSKCPINIYSDISASVKMEISFDGSNYETILPLPKPMFYSRMHSEKYREEPIVTSATQIPFQDICDEFTKIARLKKTEDFDTDDNFYTKSCLEYLNSDGNTLIQMNGEPPLRSVFVLLRSQSDELYTKLFKQFCRYQLSSLNFICDVGSGKFSVSSMTFSYSNHPKEFAKTVVHEIVCDENIQHCINNLKLLYGNIRIFGRITDLRYDVTVLFIDGHKDIKQLKYVKYSTSIFDIWSSMLDMETNISSPITSYF